jgi:cytochrome c553
VDVAGTAPRVEGRTPVERAALGYLSTNCGSCHNRQSSIASLGLFLKHSLAATGQCGPDALATTLDRPGHWLVPDAPEGTSRVVAPGEPARSALLRRATSRRPSSQMPPIGTVVADREAMALIAAWIDELAATPAPPCAASVETRQVIRPAASRTGR